MARFYKTASATPIDYMYRINAPLMERVIGANDQYITQNLQQAAQMDALASSFPYLQADEARAKVITDQYSKQVDSITKAIRDDPANWRKQLDPIRNLSKDLQQNIRVGEISKIAGNYGKYKKVADYIDEQVKEYSKTGKGISADRAKAYKEYFLNQFTATNPNGTNYNPKTGEYNDIKVFDPMGNIDIRKLLSEELDKMKADKNSYKKDEVTGKEWYFNTKKQAWEGITPERVLEVVTDRLNNPQLMDYLRQDSQVGLINGVFDNEGKFMAPYNYNGTPISPIEKTNIDNVKMQIAKTKNANLKNQLQNQLDDYESKLKGRKELTWNNRSYLAPIVRGIVNQYAYSQNEQEDLLKNNSKGSTIYSQTQSNLRHAASISQQIANRVQQKELADAREKGINDRFQQTMEWNKYKWDHPQTKSGSKTATGKKTETEIPTESTVSRLSTNSFEDWTTTDNNTGQKVKVLSNAGLSSDIEKLKREENDTNNRIKNIQSRMDFLTKTGGSYPEWNNLKVEKENLEKQLPKIQSDLNARRKWYESSLNATLSNNYNSKKDSNGNVGRDLTPEEITLYKKYTDDRTGEIKSKELESIRKKFSSAFDLNEGAIPALVTNGHKELADYLKIKKIVDARRDNFLAQMRYTPIDTDAVQLGTEDSKVITQMLFSNPQGLKLYDNTGNKTDRLGLEGKGISWFNPKGDNYKMSTVDNSLINYMVKHKVVPKVEQVGNTTKIGTGNAVLKVTFDDPNKEIPTTPFYVEVTPELQKQIGTRLSTNKDLGIKKIAGSLLDDEANDIRRQLITPTVQRTAGATDNYDPVTFTIFIGNGNHKIPFQVTKFAASDGTDHLNITGSINGTQIPLPNTPSGIPGWFNGAEDFINYIKSQRESK